MSDTASGMRVIRRDALGRLYPLPDGLHFTPAMSARAVMSHLRIVEVPMPYAERVGESKLRVSATVCDFCSQSVTRAFCINQGGSSVLERSSASWQPCFGGCTRGVLLGNQSLEEWMIYRLLLCGLLFSSAFTLMSAGALADQILSLVHHRRHTSFLAYLYDRLLDRGRAWLLAVVAALTAIVLVWPGLCNMHRPVG